ncbi:MAG: LysM peptidoglycan-binding domain-containing protein [Thermoguttaceae bacterium]|nr:LysM peptidoglycan-binding domain-containing protein [Thermoguttaceae bacterium]
MALGKLLEGAAWFATLSLATVGTLAFLPDGAWETFPTALRPARAKLAEFGVAPTRYRVDSDAKKVGETALNKDALNGEETATVENDVWAENAWRASTNVRIGERWQDVRRVEETAFVDRRNESVAFEFGEERGEIGATGTDAGIALSERNEGVAEFGGIGENGKTEESLGAFPNDAANDASTSGNAEIENWELDAIPPFVEGTEGEEDGLAAVANDALDVGNETVLPAFENVESRDVISGANEAGVGADVWGVEGNAESAEKTNVAAVVDGTIANDFNGSDELGGLSDFSGSGELDGLSDFNAVSEAPTGLLGRADAALANELNAETGAEIAAPGDETAELRDALAAVSTASTPEEIKRIFETLNRIRNERGTRLAEEDARALDAALDRLAFDVFYNPAQTILEPFWQTAPDESLATIAERLGTTPETLAEINGVKTPVDAPLPPGTTLKTIRGPVSAEISVAKKELTLRFNGLYAGRFALGVPESSANLRGVFRVVEKLANPNCDAVDANGRTISIPGGAPENPLGAAWIALDGGVGLQGTNRPELVGQTIPENGGFLFSNREIAQLSVLLPVGATVAIVD